jgi:hypothetical protein
VLAAAVVTDVRRVFDLRVRGLRLPLGLNRLLVPLAARVPLYPFSVRQRALPTTEPGPGLLLFRSIQRQRRPPLAVLTTLVDPLDPAWPLIAQTTQFGFSMQLVVKSNVPPDERRPASNP